MRLFRWLAVGCVAAAVLVATFAAGVWLVGPAKPPDAKETGGPSTPDTRKVGEARREPVRVPVVPVFVDPKPAFVEQTKPADPTPIPVLPPVEFVSKPKEVQIPLPKLPDTTPVPLPEPKLEPIPLPDFKPELPKQPDPITKLVDPVPMSPVPYMPHAGPIPEQSKPPVPLPPPAFDEVKPAPPRVQPFETPTPPEPKKPAAPPVQYLNKPDLEFEYAVGKKGKSGVKSVSLFVRDPALVSKPDAPRVRAKGDDTPDITGRWQIVNSVEVKDENTPRLRCKLLADGKYEFRLGATSGQGNAADPKDTDPADLTVVLDTTPPKIDDFTAMVDRAAAGLETPTGWVVDMTWKLTEANATERRQAVFEYRPAGEEKWRPLTDVKVGETWTSWNVTEDMPAVIAIRVTVTDKAGNVATKVIDRVNLDPVVPEGKLVKVRAVEPKKDPPKDPEPKRGEDLLLPPLPNTVERVK